MLSGRAPFYSRAKTDSASSIMRRIKEGDFRLEGDAWRYVSSAARNLTKGLLTVDPRKRFSMEQLCSSPWLAAASSQSPASQPCLLTASLLIAEPTERCLKQTYDAFHNATREGFRLTPVSSASSKLLQKRKLKQSVSSETSTSSLSDRSSFGSKSSGSLTMTSSSSKHWSDAVHSGSGRSKDLEIFSFKSGTSVQQYLTSSHPSPTATTTTSRTGIFTHPLASRAPLMVPLMVQVPTAATYSSSHFAPFTASPTLTFPASSNARFTPAPYQDSISGVSLSLIQTDHDVINSSSVIQKAGCSPAAAQPTSQSKERIQAATEICQENPLCGCPSCTAPSNEGVGDASSKAQGPLTRSRKRRLKDGEACSETQGPIDLKVAKSKMKRSGTIIIE